MAATESAPAAQVHSQDCFCEICFGHRGTDLLGLSAHYEPDVNSTYRVEFSAKPLQTQQKFKQAFQYTHIPFNSKTTCQETYIVPSKEYYSRDRPKRERAPYVPTKFEGETTTASTFDPKPLPSRPTKIQAAAYHPSKFDGETTHRADYKSFAGAAPSRPRQPPQAIYRPLPFEAVSTYGAAFTPKQVAVERKKAGVQLPKIHRQGDYHTTYMVDFKKFEVAPAANRRLFCPHGKPLPGRTMNNKLGETYSGNSLQMSNIGAGGSGPGGMGAILNMTA